MAKTLEQFIRESKEALDKTTNGTPEQVAALARHEALTQVRDAGITKTQDDLNRIDKQAKAEAKDGYESSVKEVLGMTLDEARKVMADVEGSLIDKQAKDGEGPNGEGAILERMGNALKERDEKIGALSASHADFQRRYYTEKARGRLNEAFRGAGLNEKYVDPARRLASGGPLEELIEKMAKGEDVGDDAIAEIAKGVKDAAPVFFEGTEVGGGGSGFPGIPPSPDGAPPQDLTDQQRADRSAPVF